MSPIVKDDLVRITTPSSAWTNRIGLVTDVTKSIGFAYTQFRYLIQFPDTTIQMWFTDYEVEKVHAGSSIKYSVGDTVRYKNYSTIYTVVATYNYGDTVDLVTSGKYPVPYYAVPSAILTPAIEDTDKTKCPHCGQTIPTV